MFDESGWGWQKGNTLVHLANAALGLGEIGQAERWLREAMPVVEHIDDPWQIAFALNNLGEVARSQEDYDRARPFYERAEAMYREADALGDHARLVHTLGYICLLYTSPTTGPIRPLFANGCATRRPSARTHSCLLYTSRCV